MHNHITITPLLADDVSLFIFLFISMQHTHSPHFSTNALCACQLNWQLTVCSTVYILAHNVLLASPGHAQKSKQNHNNLLRCSLHDFPISLLFLLTCPQLHTHSFPGISLAAWPIRFPDQLIKPVTKDPNASKFNHFLDQSLTWATPTTTPTCRARVCQMFWRLLHLRGDK